MGRLGTRQLVSAGLVLSLLVLGALGLPASWLGLSPGAGVALVILLVAATLWISEVVPLFVTSFVILLLEVSWLTRALPAEAELKPAAFMAPFFSDIILLFLGGFVLSSALHKFALDERLARVVLMRTGTRPARVLLGMMLVSALSSMWMSNTATTAMMLALAMPLLASVEADDPFRKAVLLGIPFSANLGGLGTPIGTPPNAIAMRYMAESGVAPSFARWMLLAAPVLVLGLAASWLLLLRLFPARAREVSLPPRAHEWSLRSRLVVGVSVVTVLLWLSGDLHGFSAGTVALLPVVVFFSLRVLDIRDFRALSWDVLFIVGGGLSLGVAVEKSGLSTRVVSAIDVADASFWVVVVAVALLTVTMSSVMSNTATANLLVPVVVALPGGFAAPMLMVVAHACSVAMALPVSTPPNAMVFSSGQVSVKDMVKAGLVISVLGLVASCTVGLWWWKLWGLF